MFFSFLWSGGLWVFHDQVHECHSIRDFLWKRHHQGRMLHPQARFLPHLPKSPHRGPTMAWAHLWAVHSCPVVLVHRSGTHLELSFFFSSWTFMVHNGLFRATEAFLGCLHVTSVVGKVGKSSDNLMVTESQWPGNAISRALDRVGRDYVAFRESFRVPRFHLFLSGLSLTGHCPALSLSKKYVSCEGWLHHVWVPETAANVPHGDARDDQPYSVYRWCLLLGFTASLSYILMPSHMTIIVTSLDSGTWGHM